MGNLPGAGCDVFVGDAREWTLVERRRACGHPPQWKSNRGMTAIYNHYAELSGGTLSHANAWDTNMSANDTEPRYTATGEVPVGYNYTRDMQGLSFVGNWATDDACNDINHFWSSMQTPNGAMSGMKSRRARKKGKGDSTNITTTNTTDKGPMLQYLENVPSWGVELIQEHHVQATEMLATTAKVRKLGYKFCAAAATASGRSVAGSSGGAAVVVKNCYAVKALLGIPDENQPWMIFPGRAAGARVLGIIRGGLIFVSVYLVTGEKPTSPTNWKILTRIAEILNLCQIPYVIGGDFQCTPKSYATQIFSGF